MEPMKLIEWIVTHPEEIIRAGRLAVIIVRRLLKRQRLKKQNPGQSRDSANHLV